MTERTALRRRALLISGALSVATGVLHLGVAVISYGSLTLEALWFAGSGVLVILIGALSLLLAAALKEVSGSAQRGRLAATTVFGNVCGLLLAVGFLSLSNWTAPQGLILAGLFSVGLIAAVGAPGVSSGPGAS